jgi:NADPH2:quinone reductase
MTTTTFSIEISGAGGPEVLKPCERKIAKPGNNQVLLQVAYAGINRPDVFQRQGLYPPPANTTDIPGLEVSGKVVAVGSDVSHLSIGDNVCALLAGGGYSNYALADAELCLPIPKGSSLAEAAALPETVFTVWFNLVEKGELKAGDVVLIQGGSSGIGTIAIQMAYAFGARVYATAGSDEKCRLCEELGAVKAFNYRNENFEDLKTLEGKGADIILDMVGGDYVQRHFNVAAPKARIINIAFLNGSTVELNLMPIMLKQLVVTGSTLRSQPIEEKRRIAHEVLENVWPLIDAGQIKPVIDSVYPLIEAAAAHRLMESSKHLGKIVLSCSD